MDSPVTTLVSKCTVSPNQKSSLGNLKLSVSDLPMLSCHYIQKGALFTRPPFPIHTLLSLLKRSLSLTLSHFPPLAGRLTTDPTTGHIYISCNDAGADFIHSTAADHISVLDVISPLHVPDFVKSFFPFDRTVSYAGHYKPILAVQVTELADGVFIGCALNHSVTDGTSLWNFFNTFAEVARGRFKKISKQPDFSRNSILISDAVLQIPAGGPTVTFDENEQLTERIFSFSREAILKLKSTVNNTNNPYNNFNSNSDMESMAKKMHDRNYNKVSGILENWFKNTVSKPAVANGVEVEISSFQCLSALLWRAVTRARKLSSTKTTTFRMAVNCRHRLSPKLDPLYFGNAIQSIPTYATAGEVVSRGLRWCAEQLNRNVVAHGDNETVRRVVEEWEGNPRCFPLGNLDGASMTMGSSPRFPMYDNDFGWGRPLAVRSGRANKFDGKISAFPGREGGGSVDLEVVLAPKTMAAIESDFEFMQFVSIV